jgi:hypothetical protein
MIVYAKAALTALEAAGLLTKLLIAAGLVGAVITAYAVWHHEVYQSGYDRAISDIAEENAEAIGHAVERRKPWRECRDRRGTWIQSTRTCQ